MKKAISLLALGAALVVLLASCTSFQISGVTIAKDASKATGTNFAIDVKVTKFLGASGGNTLANLFADATDAAIVNAVKAEIAKAGGTSATNVTINYGSTVVDLLLNYVTGDIYAPATAHVTGTIVK